MKARNGRRTCRLGSENGVWFIIKSAIIIPIQLWNSSSCAWLDWIQRRMKREFLQNNTPCTRKVLIWLLQSELHIPRHYTRLLYMAHKYSHSEKLCDIPKCPLVGKYLAQSWVQMDPDSAFLVATMHTLKLIARGKAINSAPAGYKQLGINCFVFHMILLFLWHG